MKRNIILSVIVCLLLQLTIYVPVSAKESAEVTVSSPSAILVERTTGQIVYEKDANTKRPPASVTKIMTLLLIYDALQDGRIKLADTVVVSENAASMGGSQVFLEPDEKQTVETMIKCIAIASANDACVAMAEHISGSEEAFVKAMNERADGLGMKNTTFKNCNGLDADGHETTALDIALMSRELITKYPQVQKISMIWMEDIIHETRKGSSIFGLSNTNKLVRHYPYTTGLKTGSTGKAGFCISATAKKDNLELIAVVMAGKSSKERFRDATTLLNYGFSKCTAYCDDKMLDVNTLPITGGKEDAVMIERKEPFTYIETTGANVGEIKKTTELNKDVKAPIKKGDCVGTIIYRFRDKQIGSVEIVAAESVEALDMSYALKKVLEMFGLSKV